MRRHVNVRRLDAKLSDGAGVGERAWVMRCEIDLDDEDAEHVDLVFDGLDTFAHIYLDGEYVLSSDNMFVPVCLPLRVKHGRHRLMIHFESPLVRARELQDEFGHKHRHVLSNGEASRLFVRKAQCTSESACSG